MDATELLRALGASVLAGSAAVLLVILASRPLRRRCGAGAAYALWWCVPLAMLAVQLPARTVEVPVVMSAPVLPSMTAMPVITMTELPVAASRAGIGLEWWLLAAWALGTAGVLLAGVLAQYRFEVSLGTLRRREDGLYESDAVEGLPAVVGWRPRIVLPADFSTRYSPGEQALVLAHERTHLARGDLWANALAGVLCALFWFNPLAWWAQRRFRVAQELACDAAVLAAVPGQRRSYGEALLKTNGFFTLVPLACRWPGSHPLKERIRMLESGLPNRKRRSAGHVLVAGVVLACSAGAWAMQAPREVQVAADAQPVVHESSWESSGAVAGAAGVTEGELPGTPAPGQASIRFVTVEEADALRASPESRAGAAGTRQTYAGVDLEVAGVNSLPRIIEHYLADTGRSAPVSPDATLVLLDGRPVADIDAHLAGADRIEVLSDGDAVVVNVVTRPPALQEDVVVPASSGTQDVAVALLDVRLQMDDGSGASFSPRLIVADGKPASVVRSDEDGELRVEMTVSRLGEGRVFVQMRIFRDDVLLADPALGMHEGAEGASLRLDGEAPLMLKVSVMQHDGPLPASGDMSG